MGGKVDNKLNGGSAPYIYSIGGQIFHRIGSLLPTDGKPLKFAQLYVHDTENEITNRMSCISRDVTDKPLSKHIMENLREMFDEHNALAKVFKYARNRLGVGDVQTVQIKLTAGRNHDGREYDLPTADELAILVVDETGEDTYQPDVVVQHLSNELERVSFRHPSLMALQYPILFPYGKDGWHTNIGDGVTSSVHGELDVSIPHDILVEQIVDPIVDIVEATYISRREKYADPAYFVARAILAPLHETVSSINDYMLGQFLGEEVCYYNSNSIISDVVQPDMVEAEFPVEFLNSMKIGKFLDHELKLKHGAPVILLRNIEQSTGLCIGTRLIVKSLGTWSTEVEVLTGSHTGDRVFLPRIILAFEQKRLNFTLFCNFSLHFVLQ
ncbi:hypothetical protein LINPERPRIM_LOCUS25602 [Linum perenne]